jgi:hypothetical protein
MNIKIIFKIVLTIGFLCIGVIACKKESNPNQFQRLLGKWQEVQYATDDNDNGIMDPWEIRNVNKGYLIYLSFKQDSTGIEAETINDSTTNYPFTWFPLQDDSLQRNGIGHDTIIYKIENITSLKMTLETTSNEGLVWYIYNKK